MTFAEQGFIRRIATAIVSACVLLNLHGCASGSHAAQGAAEGAAVGAASCAAGGLLSALIFGGDALGRAAESAVWCGTAGAVAGGIRGNEMDKREQQRRDSYVARLRSDVGEVAFNGFAALATCDYPRALARAEEAQRESNPNYALSGLWLEALTYADQRNESGARAMLPVLVEHDWDMESEAQADSTLRKALGDLNTIRGEYDLPLTCA